MSKRYFSIFISVFVFLFISSISIISYAGTEYELVSTRVINKADCNSRVYGQVENTYRYNCFEFCDEVEYNYSYEYQSIAYPSEIQIPNDEYFYEGAPIVPDVQVIDNDCETIDPSNYVLNISNPAKKSQV